MHTSVTQYDGFMLRRYSKTGHWGTFEHFRDIETSNHVTGLTILFLHFSPQLTNTPANFVLLSSGKKTDFTDRKAYLPLTSGEMLDFTDRKFYLSLMSGEMLDFTDRKFYLSLTSGKIDSFADVCKTTGIFVKPMCFSCKPPVNSNCKVNKVIPTLIN